MSATHVRILSPKTLPGPSGQPLMVLAKTVYGLKGLWLGGGGGDKQ